MSMGSDEENKKKADDSEIGPVEIKRKPKKSGAEDATKNLLKHAQELAKELAELNEAMEASQQPRPVAQQASVISPQKAQEGSVTSSRATQQAHVLGRATVPSALNTKKLAEAAKELKKNTEALRERRMEQMKRQASRVDVQKVSQVQHVSVKLQKAVESPGSAQKGVLHPAPAEEQAFSRTAQHGKIGMISQETRPGPQNAQQLPPLSRATVPSALNTKKLAEATKELKKNTEAFREKRMEQMKRQASRVDVQKVSQVQHVSVKLQKAVESPGSAVPQQGVRAGRRQNPSMLSAILNTIKRDLGKQSGWTDNAKRKEIFKSQVAVAIKVTQAELKKGTLSGDEKKALQKMHDVLLSMDALSNNQTKYTLERFAEQINKSYTSLPASDQKLMKDVMAMISRTKKASSEKYYVFSTGKTEGPKSSTPFYSAKKEQTSRELTQVEEKKPVKIVANESDKSVTATFSYQNKSGERHKEFRNQVKDFVNIAIGEYGKGVTADNPIKITFTGQPEQYEAAVALIMEYKKRAIQENRTFYAEHEGKPLTITSSDSLTDDENKYIEHYAKQKVSHDPNITVGDYVRKDYGTVEECIKREAGVHVSPHLAQKK